MTAQQAFDTAMAIAQNEKKAITELSDATIAFYLEMYGFDATSENIAQVRNS